MIAFLVFCIFFFALQLPLAQPTRTAVAAVGLVVFAFWALYGFFPLK